MFNLIDKVKEVNPLVLHYTNNVTITDCANTTLAIGASPLMSFSYEDPVGVFATNARTEITNKLLNEVKFDVVRGNISEIQFLGGLNVKGKGVDSFDDGADSSEIVIEVAKKLECVVVASGKTDLISDGNILYKIQNGSAKLKYITGTGCMSTSLIASLLPCTDKAIEGAVIGTLAMSLSGELADKENPPIGTYKTLLYDNLFSLSKDVLEKYARIEIEQIN